MVLEVGMEGCECTKKEALILPGVEIKDGFLEEIMTGSNLEG